MTSSERSDRGDAKTDTTVPRRPRLRESLRRLVGVAAAIGAATFIVAALGAGSASLEAYVDSPRTRLAGIAVLCLAAGTALVQIVVATLSADLGGDGGRWTPRTLGTVGVVGLLLGGYYFLSAAPGDPPLKESLWVLVPMTGIWVGLAALTMLNRRIAWLATGATGLALYIAAAV